jgi:hypothetical protein
MIFKNNITKSIARILLKKSPKDSDVKDFNQANNIRDNKKNKIIDLCPIDVIIEAPVESLISTTGACC